VRRAPFLPRSIFDNAIPQARPAVDHLWAVLRLSSTVRPDDGKGLEGDTQNWCGSFGIPYVATWGAISYLDRSKNGYLGTIGVYGSRLANWCVQAADKIVVLGSRLDNRQRTGNPNGFAPYAKILVFDVDLEELKKYHLLLLIKLLYTISG
jgi:hypothetical protein